MKVLVVDDHNLFAKGIQYIINEIDESSTVSTVTRFNEALELQRQNNFDLVLLDFFLPDVHGYEGIIKFHKNFPLTPFIVVSASESQEIACKAIELGAMGFVTKSSTAEELQKAFLKVLNGQLHVSKLKAHSLSDTANKDSLSCNDAISLYIENLNLTPKQKNSVEARIPGA